MFGLLGLLELLDMDYISEGLMSLTGAGDVRLQHCSRSPGEPHLLKWAQIGRQYAELASAMNIFLQVQFPDRKDRNPDDKPECLFRDKKNQPC